MISGENLFSNLLTVGILVGLALIVYLKMANKTLVEFISGLREAFADKTDEAVEYVPNAFNDIR
jgi:hypothetical protein